MKHTVACIDMQSHIQRAIPSHLMPHAAQLMALSGAAAQVTQEDAIPYDRQTGVLATGVQFHITDPSDVQPSVRSLLRMRCVFSSNRCDHRFLTHGFQDLRWLAAPESVVDRRSSRG